MPVMPDATILAFQGKSPQLADDVLVTSGARLIGDLSIGRQSSVWFNTVIRADVNFIKIGERTNIQDNSTVHVTAGGSPCIIGNDVTIGHNAIIHACTIEDFCLIGMGAVIFDRALIREGSIVGAGALVTQGREFPPHSLIIGSPAKAVRQLTPEESQKLRESAKDYVITAQKYFG